MKQTIIFLSFLFSYSSSAEILLMNPAICDGVWKNKTEAQQNAANLMEEVYKKENIDIGRCYAWTNLGQESLWYELARDFEIHGVNIETKQYLGSWPLTRWSHFVRVNEVQERIKENSLVREKLTLHKPGIGCFVNTPLRYGDIDQDEKNELILFLQNDFVVFSATLGKTVFSEELAIIDWVSAEHTREAHHDEVKGYQEYPNDPQYDSSLSYAGGMNVHVKGYRGYSKLYIDDFDQNGKTDIVVWRKLYQSKLENDSVRGFDFIRNHWLHFEKSDQADTIGEYLPQDTSESMVQNWLITNNQTWQSGFPHKGECEGQTSSTQFEMHDPLLNDPDVLK